MNAADIRRVREAYNLSTAQFAQVLAVARPTVYGWESGRTTPGPHERLILWKLAQATHDPVEFSRTFRAVMDAVQAQEAAPAADASPWTSQAVSFGLGALLGALFASSLGAGEEPPQDARKPRRRKKRKS